MVGNHAKQILSHKRLLIQTVEAKTKVSKTECSSTATAMKLLNDSALQAKKPIQVNTCARNQEITFKSIIKISHVVVLTVMGVPKYVDSVIQYFFNHKLLKD